MEIVVSVCPTTLTDDSKLMSGTFSSEKCVSIVPSGCVFAAKVSICACDSNIPAANSELAIFFFILYLRTTFILIDFCCHFTV